MEIPFLFGSEKQSIQWQDNNSFEIRCRLTPGLYTVGLQNDLTDFDWDRLYMPMTKYRNSGQRTGPWDFDLYNENTPLLPTWRLYRSGRYIGIFYLQRPTVEDLDNKVLRGEFGFHVEQEEEVVITAEPYNEFTIRPIACYLERNAFDSIVHQEWTGKGLKANWAWQVAHETGWEAIRQKVTGTEWQSFLEQGLTAVIKGSPDAVIAHDGLMLAAFCYQLKQDGELKETIVRTVRGLLDLPAWGNPNPYGYGHNGDMGCALIIKHLSVVYNWFHDELGDLRTPLLDRLNLQMELFFEQQLLLTQYWGGACLQDHGYRSSPSIGFAAINLVGHSEVAEKILSFYIPRYFRTLEKQPVDGFIPFSQYHKLQLYANDMTDFRIAYKYASGNDPYAMTVAYQNVPHYLMSCLDEKSMRTMICVTRGDRKTFECGLPFLMVMAKEFSCKCARYLGHLLMEANRGAAFSGLPPKVYEVLPMSILEYEDGVFADEKPDTPAMNVFSDGGAIQYRDEASRFNVAVMCQVNSSSHHSLGSDLSGTDMGISNPSMGAFTVGLGNEMLLQTAESGYRTGSELGNVLLVDGKGQYGDNGYAMGVPMRTWRGHRIQNYRFDAETGKGFARLNLGPAYPDEMAVMTYTRDFFFNPDHVRVRDTVISRHPHEFKYWFNTYRKHRIEQRDDLTFVFAGDEAAVELRLSGPDCRFTVDDTDVVWAYGNEQDDEPFKHLEVRLREKTDAFAIDFVVRPLTG